MFEFSGLTGSAGFRGRVERSLKQGISMAAAIFRGDSAGRNEVRRMMLALVKTVLGNGSEQLPADDLALLREMLSESYSPPEVDRMLSELRTLPPVTAAEAAPVFRELDPEEKSRTVRSLLVMTAAAARPVQAQELIAGFAGLIGISDAELAGLAAGVEVEQSQRRRIIRSGAGVLVALIVIGVFILTATLLRSVIFGLIIAYLTLPLEKYFERRLRSGKGAGFWFFRFLDWLKSPLFALASSIRRRNNTEASAEELARREERTIISHAVVLTSGVLLVLLLAVVIGLSQLTNHYVHNISSSVRDWTVRNLPAPGESAPPASAAEPAVPVVEAESPSVAGSVAAAPAAPAVPAAGVQLAESGAQSLLDQAHLYLERLRERFESLPLIRWGLDQIGRVLNDENARQELAGILLRRTGGLFSFTAGVIGTIGALIGDLLLTVFFYLLFLSKLAEFCSSGDSAGKQSEYLVRTVFNGSWLPDANDATIAEAQRIIGEVMNKLRIWVRGYLTLMLVDGTVYTTLFFFLKVPYFALLGPLAGCGILLPYIGPVLSAALTVLVTLAVGGSEVSGLQLVGILGAYLLYNGVIEQFILYPAVIGESLGLTTLETIIVVLLGAIFAGIAGMILALPAAAVIKYLVPQIYKCWGTHPLAKLRTRNEKITS